MVNSLLRYWPDADRLEFCKLVERLPAKHKTQMNVSRALRTDAKWPADEVSILLRSDTPYDKSIYTSAAAGLA
jgi:hypothetical protein